MGVKSNCAVVLSLVLATAGWAVAAAGYEEIVDQRLHDRDSDGCGDGVGQEHPAHSPPEGQPEREREQGALDEREAAGAEDDQPGFARDRDNTHIRMGVVWQEQDPGDDKR